MSELVITAAGFTIQPLVGLRDGPAVLRWAYSRSFLTSDNIQINWGTISSGFAVTTPCAIADGLLSVEQDTQLWTTDDAQDIDPLSIFISAWLLTPRGQLIQQLLIANKAQWVVPVSLAPTTSWAEFSNYNQANALYYYNPNYYNAPETDRQIRLYAATNYASDTHLGGVYTSVIPAIPSQPVAWITDDPLVRDAVAIQGVEVSVTAPIDTQVLAFNQATNQYEPSNQNPGTGNVVSNEVSSVDGQMALASGTGGKTIKFDSTTTGILRTDSGIPSAAEQTESTLTGRGEGSGDGALEALTLGSNLSMSGKTLNVTGAAGGDIKADGTVPFVADESMGGFSLIDLATPDALTDAANKDFVLQSVAAAVQQTPNISALVSGGGVIWESAYIFRVSQATYLIQGDLFSSTEQTITLDAADATLDRIDVIALNTSGAVAKITGTAAAQPSQPDVDPGTQLQLTFVFVGAATSAPANVVNEDIYIDNAEWTATTSGTGWNPNSTNNPHSGTKDIEGTNVANNAYVQLQAPAPLTLDVYALLSVFIRSKATWPKNRSLLFQWYSAGVAKGLAVTVNTGFFGFNSSQISTYQLLAIPLAQFAVPAGTSINQLRITDKGGAIGMYIDDLVLQAFGGDIGPPSTSGLTQEQADARYLQQANNLGDVVSASSARTNIGAQAGPLTGDVTTSGAAATLANTAVTPGSYTNTNLTVDAKGRITTAANGAAGPGSSIPATVQGDTLFASAVDTLTALPKDTNATRYLSNTGTSNNPAWAQVALSTGISGFGTGVATALSVNVGSAGALIVNGGVLGTPSSGTLSACTGLPISTGVSGLGTGVATALAVNVGSAGAPVVNGGALGTPSSGTLTSCSGLPISTGVSGLGSNVATFLQTPSSANLAAALTDETGSGLLVFATSPVFSTDITLPNGASPTTGSVAKMAFDTDAWAASRGAVQVHDGTANTYLVGVLASDTPSNGQVPTWNTGGTVTWETPASSGIGGSTGATDNAVLRADGTGGATVQSSPVTIADTTGTITLPSGAGDKIILGSNNFGIGTESSENAVTIWAQASLRFRQGGTTVSGGTEVFFVGGSPATLTVNTLAPQITKYASSTGDKTWWQTGTSSYGTAIESDNCVTQWSQDRHRWRIGGSSGTSGTSTMLLEAAALTFPTGSTFVVDAGRSFVSSQFDKTNTTLANVTGLSATLAAGKTYAFEAVLFIDADITGGSKYAIAGTATATTIKYEIVLIADATNLMTITSRQTALAGSAGQAGTTAGICRISGTITVNAAGTLTVQFAQNAANGTSSVLTMSAFRVWQLN